VSDDADLLPAEPPEVTQEVYFLPSENQLPDMFVPRAPLGEAARRAGWQGFFIKLAGFEGRIVKVYSESLRSTDNFIIF
jgi:hypothetical protein